MEMHYNELGNDIRLIKLGGQLDIIGTGEIESLARDLSDKNSAI
jgi:hypothetical protein